MRRQFPLWPFITGMLLTAIAAGYAFLSAISTASLRFWYCGPTSLDAVEPTCRMGSKLLYLSYGLGALSGALGLIALALAWRRRKA